VKIVQWVNLCKEVFDMERCISHFFFVKPLNICANEEESLSSMVNVHNHEDEKKCRLQFVCTCISICKF